MKAYGDEMKSTRCPYSKTELDKEIRSVIWNTQPLEVSATHTKRRLWPAVASAAILAAIVIPTAIFTSKDKKADEITTVKIDGEKIFFACNSGCAADATIDNFKDFLNRPAN